MQTDNNTKTRSSSRDKIIIAFIIIMAITLVIIISRIRAAHALEHHTEEQIIPTVVIMKAPRAPASEEIILPGTVQSWHEAPIYARANGYLKYWKTDIGAHVKAGQLLAEIETPEIDAELRQAKADLVTAEANNQLAQTTAKRWIELLKKDSVSKQETDEKIGDAHAKAAAVASARANMDRLQELGSFKRVTAPFNGVITARNTDTGALINAGSNGSALELFHIAQTDLLRVYVQVPEINASTLAPGLVAELHFAEHPGKIYPAVLVKTANALDPTARTLLCEFEVDNSSEELLSGGYTEAHWKLPSPQGSVHLPVNTLLFRADGMQVATIDANNRAILKSITIGRDFGNEVEVVAGVTPGESIIVNPPDSLVNGQQVRVAPPVKDDKKP